MKQYIYDDQNNCTNDDCMYYKSDGVLAYYCIAKNKYGWKYSINVESKSVTICTPIGLNEEDVCTNKSQAIELAKFELKQMLLSSNYNGRFDGVLLAMGEVVKPKIEVINKPQLSLF